MLVSRLLRKQYSYQDTGYNVRRCGCTGRYRGTVLFCCVWSEWAACLPRVRRQAVARAAVQEELAHIAPVHEILAGLGADEEHTRGISQKLKPWCVCEMPGAPRWRSGIWDALQ